MRSGSEHRYQTNLRKKRRNNNGRGVAEWKWNVHYKINTVRWGSSAGDFWGWRKSAKMGETSKELHISERISLEVPTPTDDRSSKNTGNHSHNDVYGRTQLLDADRENFLACARRENV